MRSSGGVYFERLDHIRALAAFLVFLWHFVHVDQIVAFNYAPAFPLILLAQGHIGVSLFMTLSGYLFAKLLLGKNIIYTAFVWNRILRLVPLLLVAQALTALQNHFQGGSLSGYGRDLLLGLVLPTWPNGQWSIAVERYRLCCVSPDVIPFAFYMLLQPPYYCVGQSLKSSDKSGI